MKLLLAALLIPLLGASCTTTPESPAQTVYAIHGTYAAALTVAVKYKQLPPCPTVVICSDAAVVKRIQAADDTAYVALKAAQDVARLGGTDTTVIEKARSAVSIFSQLASALRIQ